MDAQLSFLILVAFVLSLFLYKTLEGTPFLGSASLLASAQTSEYDLNTFLKHASRPRFSKKRFLFSEEAIVSMTYRFNGRFDSIVTHWDNGPILDAVIERKFPRKHLPNKPLPEDMFQASLYALALKEKGLSISSTKLVTIYCLQDDAERCLKTGKRSCLHCDNRVMFSRKFEEKKTVKTIECLDEIWYRDRKPKPNPSKRICRICPYSYNGVCNYSIV